MGAIIFLVKPGSIGDVLSKLENIYDIDHESKYHDYFNVLRYSCKGHVMTVITNQYDHILGGGFLNKSKIGLIKNYNGSISIFRDYYYRENKYDKFEINIFLHQKNPILLEELKLIMSKVRHEINPIMLNGTIENEFHVFECASEFIVFKGIASVNNFYDVEDSLRLIYELSK